MNFKYNPGFSSDEDLIGAFVVRQKELQQILQTIQENTGRLSTGQKTYYFQRLGFKGIKV